MTDKCSTQKCDREEIKDKCETKNSKKCSC